MDYTFAIIDSDATSNLQLRMHLQDYGDFSCSGTAKDPDEGLNHILKFLPDVVLVNLNELAPDHFQMVTDLYQYLQKLPLFIGFSKTPAHAYKAIKNGFFDYWLLPHSEHEIRKTVLRLRKQMPKETVPTTICLKSYRDYHYLSTDDILYLKADNNATDFIMIDGRVISAYKTLKSFEMQLPESFIRVHQSYILNSKYVSRINYGKSTCTLRVDDSQLPFSKSYKKSVDTLKRILSKSAIQTLS